MMVLYGWKYSGNAQIVAVPMTTGTSAQEQKIIFLCQL
ncbi:hypothetical protein L292_2107 [Acinetobacter junii CIP 107470 = MTCC 11364]|uniref:Uncharacterized protein n=1 Tax=Acinetobacter junii CIP 107470 = MTCC 11364 TaxID=1217666 RepID=S7YFS3_ACIJU|nr:hypothetical protein L292_2107 [Acinetobacter junii CIP 107470 = MTCC 11364]